MNILWLSWKDEGHPLAGGAEAVSSTIRKRMAADGHNVKLLTARYPKSTQHETVDGVDIYRGGGRFGVYWHAFRYFRKNLRSWPDIIVDEMNTLPFGAAFYAKKPAVLLTYQLARQVWFYQMIFPISLVGYLLEPVYLFALSWKYRQVLTESDSTRQDLARYGFDPKNVTVFRVDLSLEPVKQLAKKSEPRQILSLGAVRPMKRTLHAVKGFEAARDDNPELRLVVAGSTEGPYGQKVTQYIDSSRHKEAITVLGRVSHEERLKLMRESALIVVTSIKEGWGLIITEAASQGTPAVAYDTDGLRDSVQDGKTGLLVARGDTKALGAAINQMLANGADYETFRHGAWQWSKQFTAENSYRDFWKGLKKLIKT